MSHIVRTVVAVGLLAGCRQLTPCSGEGESAGGFALHPRSCCDDLVLVSRSVPVDDTDGVGQCTEVPADAGGVCTACGDGACGPDENRCNCPDDCEEPAFDAFGQACPPGGVVTLTYTVVHDGCREQVTEDRCAAWWGASRSGDDMLTWIGEVDGRCIVRSQWHGEADYRSDPRVVDYGAGDSCGAADVPDCAP
jgi:hypothetical protein